ncbi:hypothetical protein ALC56_12709 [Trachymyrmex septentrionalis]|uniref:BED-type domain-containing protein n=1 Tax=Trachymyrmex septentrionalis TaxID=34720 RepID=A0A151JTP8_9HYME|nr:hypothetical protein ALC56_12709 [Trachymyrmex septentrionalis]
MADQELEDNKVPGREWLRKHYIQAELEYMAICRHCSLMIIYKRGIYLLYTHLRNKHSELLTKEQKRDEYVYWVWDYFIPKANQKAQCNICNRLIDFKQLYNLDLHLHTHRLT